MKLDNWLLLEGGIIKFNRNNTEIFITPDKGVFRIKVYDRLGNLAFNTLRDAKQKLFSILDNGSLAEYLKKNGLNERPLVPRRRTVKGDKGKNKRRRKIPQDGPPEE
jgi:allantoicase